MIARGFDSDGASPKSRPYHFHEMPGLRRERFDVRDLGQVFTHIHDQEITISERFYLDSLT
jgi:hypothetical protein